MVTPTGPADVEWSQLMAAAQDGDRAAYSQLLRDIVPFIRSVVADHHRARPDRLEDVVQDVLVTVHRVRHTYDPSRSFVNWLATIARRRSIDALRRRGRIEGFEIHDEQAYETFADGGTNEEDVDKGFRAKRLRAAIAALPPGQREAVELLKIKEMTLVEASRASGKSVAALKVNVHRAIRALQVRLKGSAEG